MELKTLGVNQFERLGQVYRTPIVEGRLPAIARGQERETPADAVERFADVGRKTIFRRGTTLPPPRINDALHELGSI